MRSTSAFILFSVIFALTALFPEPLFVAQEQPQSGNDIIVISPSDFNPSDEAGSRWVHQPLGNIRPTEYRLAERENGSVVIEAVSEQSASGLVMPLRFDPAKYPVIEWEWMIDSVLENGDLNRRDGDDFAGRLYLTFDLPSSELRFRDRIFLLALRTFTSFDIPNRALCYIWANRAPAGTIAPSPYTGLVKLLAVRSGNDEAGTWVTERRNILEDYREAFGAEPPAITGIQIMTDSDDTGESARAWYGQIRLMRE
ncbi:MAG: DUF3047 domain-containing protein [Balneolales bacterium]|nr:DUF3047 domain-containing protein [Balneolales bacterium]